MRAHYRRATAAARAAPAPAPLPSDDTFARYLAATHCATAGGGGGSTRTYHGLSTSYLARVRGAGRGGDAGAKGADGAAGDA